MSSASEAVRHVSADLAAAMLEGVNAAAAAFSGGSGLPYVVQYMIAVACMHGTLAAAWGAACLQPWRAPCSMLRRPRGLPAAAGRLTARAALCSAPAQVTSSSG